MTRKKKLFVIAAPILALFIAASVLAFQTVVGGGTKETDSQTTSGLSGTLTFPDQTGTQVNQWEIIVNGTPATVSVTINGVMPGGTLTALGTSTSTSNSVVTATGGPYKSFQVAYTLTGGTSPTLTINRVGTSSSNKLGAVVGAVAAVANKVFGVAWVEATTQAGSDIETQISNACSAISTNGGGIISLTWSGAKLGALGSNPFAGCPNAPGNGNGVMFVFLGAANQEVDISAPWVLPNHSRIYGLGRSMTKIAASAAFKTNFANKRNAALAQTTGLSRAAGGTVTATFTNTNAALGQAIVPLEPVQVGCASATDAAFVGIWNVVSASATQITYNQPQLTTQTNTGGACTIIAGTPLVDFGIGTYGVTSGGQFAIGIQGVQLECDDVSPATGCEGVRNIYSQERTFIRDVSVTNFNFIGIVLDNMQSSGLQNAGLFTDIELYPAPNADTHANNCNPTSTPGPYPLEGIYIYGLGIRGFDNVTFAATSCSLTTPVANTNPLMIAFETSESGPFSARSTHCETANICWEIGAQQASTGGVTLQNLVGPPNDVTRTWAGNSATIHINQNYATTDVVAIALKRNAIQTNSILNDFSGDALSGGGDATVANYSWDRFSSVDTVLTTSQSVPNRMNQVLAQLSRANVHLTAQTASIATATLCSGTATVLGNCSVAGQYHVHWEMVQTGTACGTPAPGQVTFTLTWTATNGVVHTVIWPMVGEGSGATAPVLQAPFFFQATNANGFASGDASISTNGSVIQYATTYTACGAGTGSYNITASVYRLQ